MVVGQGLTGQGVWFGLAEVWNGISWTRSELLSPKTNDQAPIVSCDANFTCLVVGLTSDGEGNFAMVWRHDTWRLTPPIPRSRTHSTCRKGDTCAPLLQPVVHDLSCTSDGSCVGVGDIVLLRWDGVRWSHLTSPSKEIGLFGVSCPQPSSCVAVGFRYAREQPPCLLPAQWVHMVGCVAHFIWARPLPRLRCDRLRHCSELSCGGKRVAPDSSVRRGTLLEIERFVHQHVALGWEDLAGASISSAPLGSCRALVVNPPTPSRQ